MAKGPIWVRARDTFANGLNAYQPARRTPQRKATAPRPPVGGELPRLLFPRGSGPQAGNPASATKRPAHKAAFIKFYAPKASTKPSTKPSAKSSRAGVAARKPPKKPLARGKATVRQAKIQSALHGSVNTYGWADPAPRGTPKPPRYGR